MTNSLLPKFTLFSDNQDIQSLVNIDDLGSFGTSVEEFGRSNRATLIWLSIVLIVACFSVMTCIGCLNAYRYIIK